MSKFHGTDKSVHDKKVKTGVLLVNLGTPEEATPSAVRRYLGEFLSDPRVVEIPRLIWLMILHGIILRIRPKKSAKLYQSIWTSEGSPIMVISKQQAEKVSQYCHEHYGDNVRVALAMRYGQPSIASELKKMQEDGVRKVVVLPLYPQYAAPTTGSVFDALSKELSTWRWVPELHFINTYHDNPLYIEALANTAKEHFATHGKPEKLVFSYHGMPKLFHENGDPYYCLCHKTTRLLVEKLGLSDDEYVMTFQSRFGKAEWLQPYTDVTLELLAKDGVKNIAIMSPAFSADCLETLEELEHENREVFVEAGGEKYHYIPALNDRADHIEMMVKLIKPYL